MQEVNGDKTSFRRAGNLAPLLGISDDEAADYSLEGRLSVIGKLQRARRTEIERGKAQSWLYDVNRHLQLCTALRIEYEELAAELKRGKMRPRHDV
jgi:hypothetical protein